MPLFYVQDPDRPMHVIAKDLSEAWDKYANHILDESGDTGDPKGITFVCDDEDLIR